MKKLLSLLVAVTMVFSLAACTAAPETTASAAPEAKGTTTEGKKYVIANVPKLTGIAWFDRMNEGVKQFAADTGHEYFQTGSTTADAALQIQAIEGLIAQKVDAITVVPFSVEALEPVLKKARDAGIVVIAHEASSIQNADYDLEAFTNKDYGENFIKALAKGMGESGEYTTFVGSLTSKTHNEWVDASVNYQTANYPNMKVVSNKNESNDNTETAYTKTKQLLQQFPNLKGIQGSAGTDAAGAAQAVQEAGLAGKITIVGTSVPSVSKKYIDDGTITQIACWDPALAGYVMGQIAVEVLEKREIKSGHNFNQTGYENVTLDGKVIYGNASLTIDKSNVDKYKF